MAATVTLSNGKTIAITAIDADWTWTDTFPQAYKEGLEVSSITFWPGAVSDKVCILDQSASGGMLFPKNAFLFESPFTMFFTPGTFLKPFIDYSECTLSSGHSVIITLWSPVTR